VPNFVIILNTYSSIFMLWWIILAITVIL